MHGLVAILQNFQESIKQFWPLFDYTAEKSSYHWTFGLGDTDGSCGGQQYFERSLWIIDLISADKLF